MTNPCSYTDGHSVNGGPFRYCACGWIEAPELTDAQAAEVQRFGLDEEA